jgi:ferrochelatase
MAARAPTPAKAGVLMVSLGTPEAPTPRAVRRFLREFLGDPRVVEISRPVWWVVLNLFILPFRPARTARKYAAVWMKDGSPLRVYHGRQVQLLRGYLGERFKRAVPVAGAMRYGKPGIAEGLAELRSAGCDRVVVLPMYPQYAASTTASVNDALEAAMRRLRYAPRIRFVEDFHAHVPYVKAVARNVGEYWMKHGRPDRLLMSFHGLPQRSVDRGDPYQKQCLATASAVATELGWNDARTVVTFQSRFGAQQWLRPYTDETLAALGREGVGRVDVICPGFAADCLETLEEIAIEGRDTFRAAGGREFHYIPTTNDTPAWMTALTILVGEELLALEAGGSGGDEPAR